MAECVKCRNYTKYKGGLCYSCFIKDSVKDGDGETFIAEYLDYEFIKYEREYVLNNLEGDIKSHRRLDFYLPKYKIGIEFFGGWNNSADERKRYREKKNVYYKNNVPCIYLFPDNLGIIDHIFKRRMIKELKRCNFKKNFSISEQNN